MRIEYLYYFKRLAETLSYTKTAKDLYIAQPTLSVAIKRMEKEYGFTLFERGGFEGGGDPCTPYPGWRVDVRTCKYCIKEL